MRWVRTERLSLVVFAVALTVRVLFLVAPPAPEWKPDSQAYDMLAMGLLDGKGYVNSRGEATSWLPPGYPLFLAAVYWAIGRNLDAVRLAQAILDATTCLIVYVLAFRIFGNRVALVAAGLATFSLGLLSAARLILTESLFTFLVALSVLMLHAGLARPSRTALGGAGFALGLGTLTKGTLLLPTLLLGWVIWRASQGNTRVALERWTLVMLCFGLTLLPWTGRNYVVHQKFVPVSTQVGYLVYCGYHPFQGKIFGICAGDETLERLRTALPEAEASWALVNETFRYVGEHPGVVPKNLLLKVIYFLSPIDWELIPGAGVVNFTFAFAAPFAIYGLWLARRSGWQAGLLTTMLVGFLLTAILTQGSPRYRLPVEPLMVIFSGLGLVETVRRFEKHHTLVLSGIGAYFAVTIVAYMFSGQVRFVGRFLLGSVGLW